MAAGEAAEAAGDPGAAVGFYERIAEQRGRSPRTCCRVSAAPHLQPAIAESGRGVRPRHYEFPLTDAATTAGEQLPSLQDQVTRNGYKRDLGRALILFGARRYTEARAAFQALQTVVEGTTRSSSICASPSATST